MKQILFILLAFSSLQLLAQDDCQELLNSHIKIVDSSEALIKTLVSKNSVDITQFEVSNLQKMLTNRYAHLKQTLEAYNSENGCKPALLGEAVAIYDFTQLGSRALNNTTTRRIVDTIVKYPKYNLTGLKKMYAQYTSHKFIQNFLEKLSEEKISLPDNMSISADINDGKFVRSSDVAVKSASAVVSGAARVWGFLSDKLKWRNGRLNKNEHVIETLKQTLKPLDMIFETRTFVLSNLTIPGHWGHVAVWLGTKEELEHTPMWEEEFFKPFREAVEAGKNIVEIRKPGMHFVSLEEFTNLDEIAVTRINGIESNIESIMEGLADELDSQYDFTFNALTPDKITCAEMIAYTYGDIHWPGMKTILNVSLRPDDMAILSLYKNTPAEFVLYMKGKKDGSVEDKSIDDWKELFKDRLKKDLVYGED
jgi:hypothetical protein